MAGLRAAPLEAWTPKDLALTTHALACLGVLEEDVLAKVADSIQGKLEECKPQDMSNIVWACGQTMHRHPALLAAVAEHLAASGADVGAEAGRLQEFSPQAMSNIVHAYGRLGFRHEGMLEAMGRQAMVRLSDFNHQNVSNFLLGFAKLEYAHAPLLHAMSAGLSDARLESFSPQAVANTVFSFAHLGTPALLFTLLGRVARLLRPPGRLREFASRDIAALASSCVVQLAPPTMSHARYSPVWRRFARVRP